MWGWGKLWVGPWAWAHLGVEHVDAEVAESRLEEVVLGAVLEQRAVHGICPHLQVRGGGQPEGQGHCQALGGQLGSGFVPQWGPVNPGPRGQGEERPALGKSATGL